MTTSRHRGVDWLPIGQALFLILLTCGCYYPSLGGPFLWDDDVLLTANPLVQSRSGLWQIWFSTNPVDYFPLTYTSFWLEWPLWGADPLGYRAVNLALHIGAALLLWRLLATWRLPGAWWAALLFALHPLNVASVAWIAERKNTLSMVFYLAALLCCARSELSDAPKRRRLFYWAGLFAFALALASKASVVMLPCVLLLIKWWQHGKMEWRDFRRAAPFFGLSLAAGFATLWFQHHRAMAPQALAAALPPASRAVLLGKALCFYLGKTFLPYPLIMIYPRWRLSPVHAGDFLPLIFLALLAVGAAWLSVRRGWRGPAAALAYFCLTLLPVAGLFHMSFYSFSYVSDHLAYLAVPGMCALCGAVAFAPRLPRVAPIAVLALAAGGCAWLSWSRAEEFGSAEKLWRDTVALNPNSAIAQNNYGLALNRAGNLPAAEAGFRDALRLDPACWDAQTNLAAVLEKERRWPEAAAAYRRVLAHGQEPADYNNYGVVLLYLGDSDAATRQFRRALQLDPRLLSAPIQPRQDAKTPRPCLVLERLHDPLRILYFRFLIELQLHDPAVLIARPFATGYKRIGIRAECCQQIRDLPVMPANQNVLPVVARFQRLDELGIVLVLILRVDGQSDRFAQRQDRQVRTLAFGRRRRCEQSRELDRRPIDRVVFKVLHVGVGSRLASRGQSAAFIRLFCVADDQNRGLFEALGGFAFLVLLFLVVLSAYRQDGPGYEP